MSLELESRLISLDNLYLDPNNPRFIEQITRNYSEKDITSEKAQNYSFEQLDKIGSLSDLQKTIKSQTFIPMDQIVVREIENQPGSYVVLEGNRRVASCKRLMEDYESYTWPEMDPERAKEVLKSIENLQCLVYLNQPPDPDISWTLQGLRHVTGAKNWSPYAQAHHVATLVKRGLEPKDIASQLGTNASKVNTDMRAYSTFQQAKEEFGSDYGINNSEFSYFVESVGKIADFQEWLGYDKLEKKCLNNQNLEKLVRAITPSGEDQQPNIPMAIDLRTLGKALKIGRPDLAEDVMEGNKTVDELKPEVENVSNMGLNPIINGCNRAKDLLMKITTKHYDENSSAIDECLKELEKAMKSVRTKLD